MSAAIRDRSQLLGDGSGGALTTNLTLAKPTLAQAGDWAIAVIDADSGTNALGLSSAPAGWTQLLATGAVQRNAGWKYVWVYSKYIAGGDPASWTWTLNAQVAAYDCHLVALSGVNGVTPTEGFASSTLPNQGALPQSIARSVVTTGPRTVLTIFCGSSNSGSVNWTENAGVEQFDVANGGVMAVAVNLLNVGGSGTTTVTGTLNFSGGTTPIGCCLVSVGMALMPNSTAVTATDTGATVSDSIQRTKTLPRAISDTGTTFGELLRAGVKLFDTGVTLSDVVAPLRFTRVLSTTGVSFSESILRQKGQLRLMSDLGATIADIVGGGNVRAKFITETGATITDTVAAQFSATVPAPPPPQIVTDSRAKLDAMLGDLQPELLEDPSVVTVLHSLAIELQRFEDASGDIRSDFWPLWADDNFGILGWFEELFELPVAPAGLTVDQRRALIVAHFQKRIAGAGSDWEQALTQAMGSTEFTYVEGPTPYTITIRYAFASGAPNSAQVQRLARQITPAHLALVAGYSDGWLVGISLIGDPL